MAPPQGPLTNADRLRAFATSEHELFEWSDGNALWLALDEVIRYRRFIELILQRIDLDREELNAATEASIAGLRNYAGGPISSHQRTLDEHAKQAEVPLHLDIESLYLFAKILLDRLAVSIGLYFGQASKCSLASHDSFRKSLSAYVSAKGLSLPRRFVETVEQLQADVDFRDKQLVHRHRGATRGTAWNMATGDAQILIHPDKQSKDPRALVNAVDEYLDLVVWLLTTNRAKSHLRLRTQVV